MVGWGEDVNAEGMYARREGLPKEERGVILLAGTVLLTYCSEQEFVGRSFRFVGNGRIGREVHLF